MALIKCEECGQMISDKATSCPNCGSPVETINETSDNDEVSSVGGYDTDDYNELYPEDEPKKRRKPLIIAACVVVVVAIIAGSIFVKNAHSDLTSHHNLLPT